MKHEKWIEYYENHTEFGLTKDKFGIIDNEDLWVLENYNWSADKHHSGSYYIRGWDGNSVIKLHQLLMNFPENPLSIDHINRNGLDNRRTNLRIATVREQNINRGIQRNNKSGIKGVCFIEKINKWQGYIYNNNKKIYKNFDCKDDAIIWRQEKEIEYYY